MGITLQPGERLNHGGTTLKIQAIDLNESKWKPGFTYLTKFLRVQGNIHKDFVSWSEWISQSLLLCMKTIWLATSVTDRELNWALNRVVSHALQNRRFVQIAARALCRGVTPLDIWPRTSVANSQRNLMTKKIWLNSHTALFRCPMGLNVFFLFSLFFVLYSQSTVINSWFMRYGRSLIFGQFIKN